MTEQTFLFAHLSSLTALAEHLDADEAAELAAELGRAANQILTRCGAGEGEQVGDAVMACCTDAGIAVRAGLQIVSELAERRGSPAIRVGMHTDLGIEGSGGRFGPAASLAARVAAEAAGGQVLLTDATREAAGELEDVAVVPRGRRILHGGGEPVVLYEALARANDTEVDLPMDPVCRMAVDPYHCAGSLRHAGSVFYFCSLSCVTAFAAEPERFAGRQAADPPP